jgi:hypothetical protein
MIGRWTRWISQVWQTKLSFGEYINTFFFGITCTSYESLQQTTSYASVLLQTRVRINLGTHTARHDQA